MQVRERGRRGRAVRPAPGSLQAAGSCIVVVDKYHSFSLARLGWTERAPSRGGPGDLTTSWWFEQVVGVEVLEWEG